MNQGPTAENLPKDIAMPPLPQEPIEPEPIEIEENVAGASAAVDLEEPAKENEAQPETEVKQSVNPDIEKASATVLREKAKRADKLEKERDELLRRLQESENIKKTMVPDSHSVSEDTDFSIAPDDLAEGKHLNKLQKQIKLMEQKLAQYEQKTSTITAEQRVFNDMPDYRKVVTDDNIAILKTAYPELADSIGANPDLYTQAKSAYTLIRKLGIHIDDVRANERATVQNNAAKPRPLTSISPQQGDSPLTKANAFANGLTPDLREQLVKEMNDARRNH